MTLTYNFKLGLRQGGIEVIDLRFDMPIERKYARRDPAKLRGLVVHHTAHRPTGNPTAEAQRIARSQIAGGAPAIQYTLAIADDGKLLLLQPLENAPWSHGTTRLPGNENELFMSVVLFGNFWDEENPRGEIEPTPAQMSTLRHLIDLCRWKWSWHPAVSFLGHRALAPTVCPGHFVATFLKGVRRTDRPIEDPLDRQQALWLLRHYKGALDGVWGPQSEDALQAFRKAEGWTEGTWDVDTDAAVRGSMILGVR